MREKPADRQVPKVGLSREEAAWSMGVSPFAIDRLISLGEIPVCKIGHRSIIDPEDLREIMERKKILKNQ